MSGAAAGPGDTGSGNAGPGNAGPGNAGSGNAGSGNAGPGNAGPGSPGPGEAGFGNAGPNDPRPRGGLLRRLGGGIITGAADDDPSAIGTYASAGAQFGLGFLWVVPVLLPMMYAVTYLSAKLGRVYGKGLFAALRDRYPNWVVLPLMAGAIAGNLIEAAANLGGIGAALNLLVPLPIGLLVALVAALAVGFQWFGSYDLLHRVFRWLTLALLAYPGAALLARPDLWAVLRGTFLPHLAFSADLLAMLVACLGASLSAYIYTWQSNQEVEEQIAEGRRFAWQRRGASRRELQRTRRDVLTGMLFSSLILYFILMSTGATLHAAGQTRIDSAAQAAAALRPLAGPAASWLFAAGIVGVGVLAVPVLTTGAAYNLTQALGHPGTLHASPRQARLFYATIGVVTLAAVALNGLGFNPMRALVWAGMVQGFSVPPLLFLILRMTNDPALMGERVNGWLSNALGWLTTGVSCAVTGCLVASWLA